MTPITEIPDGYPMVTVRYEGPTAKHAVVGLSTRKNYGRKAGGDIFQVHEDDVAAYPQMFTVLASPEKEPQGLPKFPTAIRQPEQVLRPSSIREVAPAPQEEALTLDAPSASAGGPDGSSFVLPQAKPRRKHRATRSK